MDVLNKITIRKALEKHSALHQPLKAAGTPAQAHALSELASFTGLSQSFLQQHLADILRFL